MSNLASDKVKVFPFGEERIHDPLARTLNEANLARLIRFVTGNTDYVLSYENDVIDFVLNGYTFSVDLTDNAGYTDETASDLYASISVSGEPYPILVGNDNVIPINPSIATKIEKGRSYFKITETTVFTYDFAEENSAEYFTYLVQSLDGEYSDLKTVSKSNPAVSVQEEISPLKDGQMSIVSFKTYDKDGNELEGCGNSFSGLSISPEEGQDSLHILTKVGTTWQIPATSYLTVSNNRVASSILERDSKDSDYAAVTNNTMSEDIKELYTRIVNLEHGDYWEEIYCGTAEDLI